jgi:glycosyltransferase involved in cell wall biosynthesis
MRHRVVMVTTSYPRFPGDSVGTFMEPIAKSVAARGHEVHIVAPWHPAITRGRAEDGVFFHFFKYAPVPALNVFGYAAGLRADEHVRGAAWAAAPLALIAGWFKALRVAQKRRATMMHGHWVVPGGVIASLARPSLPLVLSLHGSDVFVAERIGAARVLARRTFKHAAYVTACSPDLARRAVALGASNERLEVVPYGVDAGRFRPDASARSVRRASLGLPPDAPLLFTAGRLVRKKGFEYLVDALPLIAREPKPVLAIAGTGDLAGELAERVRTMGLQPQVRFLGNLPHDEIAAWLAAADVALVPSVKDDAGNVDGLPNSVLEALASGTAVVATTAGGIATVIEDGRTGLLVPERNAGALAEAVTTLLQDAEMRQRIGNSARAAILERSGWDRTAARFEAAYDRALAFTSPDR